ncbi:MAG: hypothetical protein ACRDSF_24870 [Pseudonocardiaceae bacterium]
MTYSRTTADQVCQAFAAGARLDLAGAEVPAVPILTVHPAAWSAFTTGCSSGEFD